MFELPETIDIPLFYENTLSTDIVIIGSGISGLYAAITAAKADKNVIIVNNNDLSSSSSMLAQGGIACVWDAEDNFDSHIKDTLIAGCRFNDVQAVEMLIKDGKQCVKDLIHQGMEFDKKNGFINTGREGAHSYSRILHSGGDASGKNLTEFLLKTAKKYPNISFIDDSCLYSLVCKENYCIGCIIKNMNSYTAIQSDSTILSTGGYSRLFGVSTQPTFNTGEVIAIAFLEGAVLQDLEFVQFHPTGFIKNNGQAFLISEAVRGEGAYLLNKDGQRFMSDKHELAELAPRDIVSREIIKQEKVYLDARHLGLELIKNRFPTIYKTCMENGFDISKQLLPITPVAHYSIGGIKTDIDCKTNINGLLACGEAASNGCHGANRLASNSLLEALVFGKRAGEIALTLNGPNIAFPDSISYKKNTTVDIDLNSIADSMIANVGPFRNGKHISDTIDQIKSELSKFRSPLDPDNSSKYFIMLSSYLIAFSALLREDSRGAHFRTDFPETKKEWNKRINLQKDKISFSYVGKY